MTTAIGGYGIQLQQGDGGGTEVFTTIAEVMSLQPPAVTMNTTEVTAHDGAGWKEHVTTVLELGEVTARISFVPTGTTHQSLLTDQLAGTLRNFKVVFPDSGSTEWAFAAYVTGFEPSDTGTESALEATVTLLPSQDAAPTIPTS